MKCCENDNDKSGQGKITGEKKGGGNVKHILMMVACCGLPILLLAAVPLIGGINGSVGAFISRYAFLICPILMVPMLFMMLGNNEKKNDTSPAVKRIEDVR